MQIFVLCLDTCLCHTCLLLCQYLDFFSQRISAFNNISLLIYTLERLWPRSEECFSIFACFNRDPVVGLGYDAIIFIPLHTYIHMHFHTRLALVPRTLWEGRVYKTLRTETRLLHMDTQLKKGHWNDVIMQTDRLILVCSKTCIVALLIRSIWCSFFQRKMERINIASRHVLL